MHTAAFKSLHAITIRQGGYVPKYVFYTLVTIDFRRGPCFLVKAPNVCESRATFRKTVTFHFRLNNDAKSQATPNGCVLHPKKMKDRGEISTPKFHQIFGWGGGGCGYLQDKVTRPRFSRPTE